MYRRFKNERITIKSRRDGSRKPTRKGTSNIERGFFLTPKNTIISIFKNISLKEGKRIRDYKYNLCFSTPEELFERIKKFEYETINYLDEYNKIKIQIQELKKERDEIVKEKEHEIKIETE